MWRIFEARGNGGYQISVGVRDLQRALALCGGGSAACALEKEMGPAQHGKH